MIDDPFIYGPDGFPISVKPAADAVHVELEPEPPAPTPFQLAQRSSGAAMLVIGGTILVLEHFTHGLQTPICLVALTLFLLGVGLTVKSLPLKQTNGNGF